MQQQRRRGSRTGIFCENKKHCLIPCLSGAHFQKFGT